MNHENNSNRCDGECRDDIAATGLYHNEISLIVDKILSSSRETGRLSHIGPEQIPSREVAVESIKKAFRIIYPGYFSPVSLDNININYYLGQEILDLFKMLSEQITLAIRHECLRFDLPCTHCTERGRDIALMFLKEVPLIQAMLAKDVIAAFEGDPASKHYDEIIFSYPGLFAITVNRIAHFLHEQNVPLLPRIMSEYAHSVTGIDMHPGVHVGESFFIDHGTGVVIGETTVIGNRVRIYQGVTLGALSLSKEDCEKLRNSKRHPTIEDDVVIYANATILGGDTVIGARSVIGGNVWITGSVPPDTTVFLKKPELIYKEKQY